MNIYLMDDNAFIELKSPKGIASGYMLCIGTRKEVDEATPQQLMRMVQLALATSKYRALEPINSRANNGVRNLERQLHTLEVMMKIQTKVRITFWVFMTCVALFGLLVYNLVF